MSNPIHRPTAAQFLDQYVGKEGTSARESFQANSFESQCVEAYASLPPSAAQSELRREAMDTFLGLGIPTQKSEEWRYTPVAKSLKHTFDFAPSVPKLSLQDLEQFAIPDLDAHKLVLINGTFIPELSDVAFPRGLTVMSLKEAWANGEEDITANYAQIADFKQDTFAALNTALAEDGIFIRVEQGKMLEKPVHVLNIVATDEENPAPIAVQGRLLVIAEKNAGVQIVESRVSIGSQPSFTNIVSEFSLAEHANVHYLLFQNANENASQVNHSQVVQGANSVFTTFTITFSGNMVRNNANFLPNAEFCETNLYAALIGTGNMHVDNATFVDHALPNCQSNELYKHVLTDKSVGVFNGRIMVRQDAQKTNAYQSNKTILASDAAKFYTKPELEIYADDVKCSHGAATGKLNEDEMFYLRTRGLNQAAAKRLLLLAFVGEVIEKVGNPTLRAFLSEQIAKHLTT